jgi:hypothetical protein
MKRIKKYVKIFLIIVIVTNIPPVNGIIGAILNDGLYRYSNETGSYTKSEMQLFNSKVYYGQKTIYKPCMTTTGDSILYRLFSKNPLKFWNWGEYFYRKKYELPYKSWKEIRKRRGHDLGKYATNCQDF